MWLAVARLAKLWAVDGGVNRKIAGSYLISDADVG